MVHAISYTHQASGACAGMCACDCTHQMEKTGYWDILGPKNQTRKIDKIHKDIELHQVFAHLCLQMFRYFYDIYFLYLQEKSTHFGLTALTNFGQRYQDILNYIKSSRMFFVCQNVQIFPLYIAYKKNQQIFGSEIFEVLSLFVYTFLWQNVLILPYCIPTTDILNALLSKKQFYLFFLIL